MKTFISSLVLVLSLTGCTYGLEEIGFYKTGGLKFDDIDVLKNKYADQEVNFELVKNLPLSTCQRCHSMTDEEKVFGMREKILATVEAETMPPRSGGYSPLTECEKQILRTWIDDKLHERTQLLTVKELSACGNVKQSETPKGVDFKTLEVSFENLKTHIIDQKCLKCHVVGKKTVLENLEGLKASVKQILVPKDPASPVESTPLYRAVVPPLDNPTAPPRMPPARASLAPLTADEVEYLKKFIQANQE
ncbi:hypothetical protein ACES2L_09725 [Bdellovibrio bacteriovorus]